MKSRKIKAEEYDQRYSMIPREFDKRLSWICDKYKINESKYDSILSKRDIMLNSMYYSVYRVILYEDPEGSPRPRFRLVNRKNLANMAVANSNFVQVYSITGASDRVFMKRLMNTNELYELSNIIYTPCDVEYFTFNKTPSYYNGTDQILAEIGLIRPIAKPDWDNIGKKYSDMYNGNVWIDDTCVIRGVVDKFYSVLPRIEITLRFLNALYTKQQYKQMCKKMDTNSLVYYDAKGNLIQGN